MKVINIIAMILLIIGGLNWGLKVVGVENAVESILGAGTITTIVYALVGLSAIYVVIMSLAKKCCCVACNCASTGAAQ